MLGEHSIGLDGVTINVVDIGDKSPALVFLHYWGGSSRTWRPVIESLSATNRCVAIDFRGWGKSSKASADYDLEALSEDVIGVVDQLGLQNFILVGHSMGGKVAQLVAARQPEGLQQLILLAPAPPIPLEVPEEQRQGMIASYEAREGVERVIGILSARPLSEEHREQVIEDTLRGAPAAKRAWPERGMIADISGPASQIKVPVRVIVGTADNVESEDSLRAAFESILPRAEFIVLPGVGHLAPLEAAAEVVGAIRSAMAV